MKASIIICSLNRPEALKKCLDSIRAQTYTDYEVILCQDEGNLVELKDKSWRKAKGKVCIFIDDDVICDERWLQHIMHIFEGNYWIVGVTGPTYVPEENLKNRDIFRGGLFKKFYNWFFLENKHMSPGKITSCGANTYGANYKTKLSGSYQLVDFLEPPQFAIRMSVLRAIGGFDLEYKGVGEWCDVDLCYEVAKYGILFYDPRVKVIHLPVQDKAIYEKRLETKSRYKNYIRFAGKWIKPSFKHRLYRLFLKCYYFAKGRKWV